MALCAALPLHAQIAPTIGIWPLDETSGTTANDVGPFRNHGTLRNFAGAPWTPGRFGNALTFDGVDDYVDIVRNGGMPVMDGRGTPYSVTFWVRAIAQNDKRIYTESDPRLTTIGPLYTIGSGRSSVNEATRLRIFGRNDALVETIDVTSVGPVFDGTWHHVAIVDVAGIVQIYIDGQLDVTRDYTLASRLAQAGPRTGLFGTYTTTLTTLGAVVRSTSCCFLLGDLDDFRIYRFALSATDVTAVFGNGNPPGVSASVGEFGRGCGPGPLDLSAGGSASIGGPGLSMQLARGRAGAVAALQLGVGIVTPVDLTPLGFAGCTLYGTPVVTLGLGVLDAAGVSTSLNLPIPNDPTLQFLFLNFQGIALSPGVGLDVSDAAIVTVGF